MYMRKYICICICLWAICHFLRNLIPRVWRVSLRTLGDSCLNVNICVCNNYANVIDTIYCTYVLLCNIFIYLTVKFITLFKFLSTHQ